MSDATLRVSRLQGRDESAVRDWLEVFLREHLAWWTAAIGERWSEARVAEHITARDPVATEWRGLLRAGDDPDSFVRVARTADGRAVGIVHACVRDDAYLGLPMGVLQWVFVDPAGRGQGTARLLMDACDAWMAWRDVAGREVFVTSDNAGAVRLYERHGYRVIDHRMLAPPPDVA